MKHQTKVDQLRKDINELTKKEFETKYPGVKREELKNVSDKELAGIAGGIQYVTEVAYGTRPVKLR